MKKQITSIFLMIGSILSGQELPVIVPPAPEARKMIEYGNIPVNYNTGVPNIQLPLYVFTAGDMEVPISLSYHASGVKVDDPDGYVGLKWSLAKGSGSINRSVNGRPDESTRYTVNNGWLHKVYDIQNLTPTDKQSMLNGCYDLQPDEFHYSLPNGLNGTFVFDENRNVVVIPQHEDIEIECYNDYTLASGFKITDKYGNVFEFGTTEYVDYNVNCGATQAPSCPINYHTPSSWKLDRIVLANQEVVQYTYGVDTYNESYITSQSQVLRTPIVSDVTPPSFLLTSCQSTNTYNLRPLESITHKDMTISYVYSQKPTTPATGKKLDTLRIDHGSNTVKTLHFNYVFNANDRMFLDKVASRTGSGDSELVGQFEYTNYGQFPAMGSFSKDHFGYYNGQNNNRLIPSGYYATPYVDLGNPGIWKVEYNGANRELNETTIQTGILSRITYPTAGYSTFEYGPNMAYHGQNEQEFKLINYSGLEDNATPGWTTRYSESFELETEFIFTSFVVDNFDGIDPDAIWEEPIVKLVDMQGNVYQTLQGYNFGENLVSDMVVSGLSPQTYRLQVELYNHAGFEIGCTVGGEYETNPFVRNKYYGGLRIQGITNYTDVGSPATRRTFEYQDFLNSQNSSGKVFGKYTSYEDNINYGVYNPALGTTKRQQFKKLVSNGIRSLAYNHNGAVLYENVTEVFHGPAESYSIKRHYKDWGSNVLNLTLPSNNGDIIPPNALEKYANGILWREEHLDRSGARMKSTENDHQIIISGPGEFFGYASSCEDNGGVGPVSCTVIEYPVTARWFVPTQTRDSLLFGNEAVVSVTNRFYENPVHKQLTRTETTDSYGTTLVSRTTYPEDLALPDRTTAEQDLITLKRIATPIRVVSSKKEGGANEQVLSTLYNQYRNWGNNIITLEKVRNAKGSDLPGDLEDRVEYLSYDGTGNPLEVRQSNGAVISYFWGYSDEYPVIKAENSPYAALTSAVANSLPPSFSDLESLLTSLDDITTDSTQQANWESFNQNIRSALPDDVIVTTYTHAPLVGVSSITDPRGNTTHYTYDGFNRLRAVRDHDNKLLNDYQYHYKGQ